MADNLNIMYNHWTSPKLSKRPTRNHSETKKASLHQDFSESGVMKGNSYLKIIDKVVSSTDRMCHPILMHSSKVPTQRSRAGTENMIFMKMCMEQELPQVSIRPTKVLKKDIGHHLTHCLTEVCQKRPPDPIEYIAHWLYKLRDVEFYFHEKLIFSKECLMLALDAERSLARQAKNVEKITQAMKDLQRQIVLHKSRKTRILDKYVKQYHLDPFSLENRLTQERASIMGGVIHKYTQELDAMNAKSSIRETPEAMDYIYSYGDKKIFGMFPDDKYDFGERKWSNSDSDEDQPRTEYEHLEGGKFRYEQGRKRLKRGSLFRDLMYKIRIKLKFVQYCFSKLKKRSKSMISTKSGLSKIPIQKRPRKYHVKTTEEDKGDGLDTSSNIGTSSVLTSSTTTTLTDTQTKSEPVVGSHSSTSSSSGDISHLRKVSFTHSSGKLPVHPLSRGKSGSHLKSIWPIKKKKSIDVRRQKSSGIDHSKMTHFGVEIRETMQDKLKRSGDKLKQEIKRRRGQIQGLMDAADQRTFDSFSSLDSRLRRQSDDIPFKEDSTKSLIQMGFIRVMENKIQKTKQDLSNLNKAVKIELRKLAKKTAEATYLEKETKAFEGKMGTFMAGHSDRTEQLNNLRADMIQKLNKMKEQEAELTKALGNRNDKKLKWRLLTQYREKRRLSKEIEILNDAMFEQRSDKDSAFIQSQIHDLNKKYQSVNEDFVITKTTLEIHDSSDAMDVELELCSEGKTSSTLLNEMVDADKEVDRIQDELEATKATVNEMEMNIGEIVETYQKHADMNKENSQRLIQVRKEIASIQDKIHVQKRLIDMKNHYLNVEMKHLQNGKMGRSEITREKLEVLGNIPKVSTATQHEEDVYKFLELQESGLGTVQGHCTASKVDSFYEGFSDDTIEKEMLEDIESESGMTYDEIEELRKSFNQDKDENEEDGEEEGNEAALEMNGVYDSKTYEFAEQKSMNDSRDPLLASKRKKYVKDNAHYAASSGKKNELDTAQPVISSRAQYEKDHAQPLVLLGKHNKKDDAKPVISSRNEYEKDNAQTKASSRKQFKKDNAQPVISSRNEYEKDNAQSKASSRKQFKKDNAQPEISPRIEYEKDLTKSEIISRNEYEKDNAQPKASSRKQFKKDNAQPVISPRIEYEKDLTKSEISTRNEYEQDNAQPKASSRKQLKKDNAQPVINSRNEYEKDLTKYEISSRNELEKSNAQPNASSIKQYEKGNAQPKSSSRKRYEKDNAQYDSSSEKQNEKYNVLPVDTSVESPDEEEIDDKESQQYWHKLSRRSEGPPKSFIVGQTLPWSKSESCLLPVKSELEQAAGLSKTEGLVEQVKSETDLLPEKKPRSKTIKKDQVSEECKQKTDEATVDDEETKPLIKERKDKKSNEYKENLGFMPISEFIEMNENNKYLIIESSKCVKLEDYQNPTVYQAKLAQLIRYDLLTVEELVRQFNSDLFFVKRTKDDIDSKANEMLELVKQSEYDKYKVCTVGVLLQPPELSKKPSQKKFEWTVSDDSCEYLPVEEVMNGKLDAKFMVKRSKHNLTNDKPELEDFEFLSLGEVVKPGTQGDYFIRKLTIDVGKKVSFQIVKVQDKTDRALSIVEGELFELDNVSDINTRKTSEDYEFTTLGELVDPAVQKEFIIKKLRFLDEQQYEFSTLCDVVEPNKVDKYFIRRKKGGELIDEQGVCELARQSSDDENECVVIGELLRVNKYSPSLEKAFSSKDDYVCRFSNDVNEYMTFEGLHDPDQQKLFVIRNMKEPEVTQFSDESKPCTCPLFEYNTLADLINQEKQSEYFVARKKCNEEEKMGDNLFELVKRQSDEYIPLGELLEMESNAPFLLKETTAVPYMYAAFMSEDGISEDCEIDEFIKFNDQSKYAVRKSIDLPFSTETGYKFVTIRDIVGSKRSSNFFIRKTKGDESVGKKNKFEIFTRSSQDENECHPIGELLCLNDPSAFLPGKPKNEQTSKRASISSKLKINQQQPSGSRLTSRRQSNVLDWSPSPKRRKSVKLKKVGKNLREDDMPELVIEYDDNYATRYRELFVDETDEAQDDLTYKSDSLFENYIKEAEGITDDISKYSEEDSQKSRKRRKSVLSKPTSRRKSRVVTRTGSEESVTLSIQGTVKCRWELDSRNALLCWHPILGGLHINRTRVPSLDIPAQWGDYNNDVFYHGEIYTYSPAPATTPIVSTKTSSRTTPISSSRGTRANSRQTLKVPHKPLKQTTRNVFH